jgi:hypothetical protein
MRRSVLIACLLVGAAACKSSCDDGPATDTGTRGPDSGAFVASPSVPPSTAGDAQAVGRFVRKCDFRKDAAVCSPDGTQQMSCAFGMLKTVQICDGPAGCKGSGDNLVCDLKHVDAGDPCTMGISPPRCNSASELLQCLTGKWSSLICSAPGTCHPPTSDSPAMCRQDVDSGSPQGIKDSGH